MARVGLRDNRCPHCGSFLDAPRVEPATGRTARKCAACQEWHAPSPAAAASA